MENKVRYYLNEEGEFVIENYNLAKPFASFFPGIAGIWGIPIWVFYVNRAQGIASFGIKDKDHPIMEFLPANKSYQQASLLGFRTFIKVHRGKKVIFYEAFHNGAGALGCKTENKMLITSSALKLSEINHTLGIKVEVEYFPVPNDDFGALARKVTVINLKSGSQALEILDGLPKIIPYGLNNMFLKELPRTIEAWMGVENLEKSVPFIRTKVDPSDKPEVTHIKGGNFYLTFDGKGLIKPIVDPDEIFGAINDFTYPKVFLDKAKFGYPAHQLTGGKTPCCMCHRKFVLRKSNGLTLYSLIGNMSSLKKLNDNIKRLANKQYFLNIEEGNKRVISALQDNAFVHSSSKSFDLYCRQNFLDNLMRGGYPQHLKYFDKELHIQVFSRKHGDLERDYNKFLLEPNFWSQGNGNFRDVNQNRRSDIWFVPTLKDEGIVNIFGLIQSDGYNPLVIKPDTFVFDKDLKAFDKYYRLSEVERDKLKVILEKPFTPGELLTFILENKIIPGPFKNTELDGEIKMSRGGLLCAILTNSQRISNAEHGEGFWSDHWAYCLDLLENYLGLYPESLKEILVEKKEFTFFDNSETVRPRKEKYFLKDGKVFQYHAVSNDHAKHNLIKKRPELAHLSRLKHGLGDIYRTTLAVKMLTVIANKFASLDPFGVGIEMEADKPNWYDSLNGLPGLLGSSTCETFELKRWIIFLKDSIKKLGFGEEYSLALPFEVYELLDGLGKLAEGGLGDYGFWDKSHSLKEDYRHKTILGFEGAERQISLKQLNPILGSFLNKIDAGLEKAYDKKSKLYYSYFINEASEYKVIKTTEHGHQLAWPLKFKQKPLPLFLEGVMHSLRVVEKKEEAKKIFAFVRKSELFDKKLKMYKVCAPLESMPLEIGRCRVFLPGWLENESIWLHMEYKYLLELLKNGLYDEFFSDFKNVLIPFQDPKRYGRSILENSSFLVSSAFPKKELHGTGFVARLSGSTAEFISIWLIMCAGKTPFYLDGNNKLSLEFKPILPAWLFSQKEEDGFAKNTFAFKFLNKALVVYHNPKRKNTFGSGAVSPKKITLEYFDKSRVALKTSRIGSQAASDIREGKVAKIDIFLS